MSWPISPEHLVAGDGCSRNGNPVCGPQLWPIPWPICRAHILLRQSVRPVLATPQLSRSKLNFVARHLRTRTRCAVLANIFSVARDKELHARIASVSVLFEDLRIELSGQAADDLDRLDECGKAGRRLYFIRRSIATLYEFAMLIKELDEMASFQVIRGRFDAIAGRQWDRATAYFEKYSRYVVRLRNNVGGHFGSNAGESAIKNLLPDAVGSLEVRFTDKGGGAALYFATEIAATGTLRHVPGATIPAKARRLVRHALVAYRHATRAVDCIAVYYLWDRFGK